MVKNLSELLNEGQVVDADTLDGYDASAFALSEHTHDSIGDEVILTNQDDSSVSTPSSNKTAIFVDTTGIVKTKNDAGEISVVGGSYLTQSDVPGSSEIPSGNFDSDADTGFYGEVPTSDLIDGPSLASIIGLSAGTAFNDTEPWLKFFVGKNALCNYDNLDKILFVSKKPYRCDLSWDDIDAANAVYGSQIITIDGNQYRVRLLTGAHSDPAPTYGTSCSDDPGAGSEWNDLIYRVHQDIPTCHDVTIGMPGGNETERHGGPQVGNNWANYSDNDLNVYYGDGTYNWCQETDSQDISRRVYRGDRGVASYCTFPSSGTVANGGWRVVLELV